MDKRIESLFVVVQKPDGATLRFFRIADHVGEKFIPYHRNSYNSFEESCRDIIYFPKEESDMPINGIAVYSWSNRYNNETERWEQDPLRKPDAWVEAVFFDVSSAQELVISIRQWFVLPNSSFEDNHGLLFIMHGASGKTQGIYVPYKAFERKDKKLRLKDDILTLQTFLVDRSQIRSVATTFTLGDTRFYYSRDLQKELSEPLFVHSVSEDINLLIKGRKELFAYYGRKDTQIIKRFLNELPVPLLAELLANVRKCSVSEAVTMIEQNINGILDSLDVDGEIGRILQAFVEHDALLCKELARLVREKWELEFKNEIAAATEQLHNVEQESTRQYEILQQQSERIAEYKMQIEQLKIIETSLEESIQTKISSTKTDIGAILADYAFLLPLEQDVIQYKSDISSRRLRQSEHTVLFYSETPAEIQRTKTVRGLMQNISLNAEAAGVKESEMSNCLAAYLCAAYIHKINLLLCGAGGYDIGCALSYAACGTSPAQLHITLNENAEDAISEVAYCSHPIIMVWDALGSQLNTYLRIIDLFPQKMFLFLNPFEESMIAEPEGLFRYVLPLFTSRFISEKGNREYCCFISDELPNVNRHFSSSDKYTGITRDPYIRFALETIEAEIPYIQSDVDAETACLIAGWLPLANCIGKREQLIATLKQTGGTSLIKRLVLEEV